MEFQMSEPQQIDNICHSLEFHLVDLVKSNNVAKITSLVSDNPGILNLIIGHPFNKPILYIACHNFANMVQVGTINALIKLGANLYHSDEFHDHKEAIHFSALGQNPSILKAIVDVVSCDANKLNSISLGGNTALNLLIKEGNAKSEDFGKCVQVLVDSGLNVNIIDSNCWSPIFWAAKKDYKEAVNIILTKSKQKVMPNEIVSEYIESDNSLLNSLFGCIKINEEDLFVRCLAELQLATLWHLKKAVEVLLNQGADASKSVIGDKSAVLIAVQYGFHEILAMFLRSEKLTLPGSLLTLLMMLMKRPLDGVPFASKRDYNKCYDLLINYKNLDLNVGDKLGTTALHYAALLDPTPDRTLNLLRKGASMAIRNKFNCLIVEDIDAEVLETHLNECIEINPDINLDRNDFTATFNYKTLMPPPKYKNDVQNSYFETANSLLARNTQQVDSEMEVIYYMSNSPELRHLVKHPLITSFLFMKWHRIRCFYLCNLGFYISFCLSLTLYIFVVYDKNDGSSIFLFVWLCVMWIGLMLRELFQILVSPKTYFLDLENVLEVVLVILTSLILFPENLSDNVKRQVDAVVILLAAFELVILVGQHPKMTINIVMLQTVSLNFFKFLLWYSILIIAFSLSFYILFKKDQEFFANPGLSLFKTVVMLTGEFDTGNIDFQTHPITSHVIFMLFVFMIAIILFNLLNSLAISDTQNIISNAELVSYTVRIKQIAYIERIFFGHLLPEWAINCCRYIPFNLSNKFVDSNILIESISLFPFYLKDYKLIILPNKQGKVKREWSTDCLMLMKPIGWVKWMWRWNDIYLDKQTFKRTKQMSKLHKDNQKSMVEEHKKVISEQKSMLEEQRKVISDLIHKQEIIVNQFEYIINNMTTQN